MKTISLHETSAAGDTNPLNRRYYADDRRITREEFDRIKRHSGATLSNFTNANSGGVVTFYCLATIP